MKKARINRAQVGCSRFILSFCSSNIFEALWIRPIESYHYLSASIFFRNIDALIDSNALPIASDFSVWRRYSYVFLSNIRVSMNESCVKYMVRANCRQKKWSSNCLPPHRTQIKKTNQKTETTWLIYIITNSDKCQYI